MKIGDLERVMREAIQPGLAQPARALLVGYGQGGVSLPQEFDNATKTLAARSQRQSAGQSLLHAAKAHWA